MPPSRDSRYLNCRAMQDTDGRWFLSLPTPVRHQILPGNRTYASLGGETWWGLAEGFYGPGQGMKKWWHLMNFQPEPAVDPTILLAPGTQVVYPLRADLEALIDAMRRDGG